MTAYDHPARPPHPSRNLFTETLAQARRSVGGPAQRAAPPPRPPPPSAPPSSASGGGLEGPAERGKRLVRAGQGPIVALVASILVLQVLSALHVVPWTPGLILHGGLDRLIEYGLARHVRLAEWARTGLDVILCVYWAVVLLAMSGLGAGAPPTLLPGEVGWVFLQRRAAYAPALAALLAVHAIAAVIAHAGWWPLAALIEIPGHLGLAALLYILLVPEGRRRLVIIEDRLRNGFGNRIHVSPGYFASTRRWLTVRHDHLRGAEQHDPLWARLLDVAHVELTYLDATLHPCTQIVRGIGSKQDLSFVASQLSGPFRIGRPLLFTLPPSFANMPQASQRREEETSPL